MNDTILSVKNLSYGYASERDNSYALRDVNFSVKRGEFFVILGPSGCGKSTLLRLIAGLMPIQDGSIIFDPPTMAERRSMVFQSFAIFPWLTVKDNILVGLNMHGMNQDEQDKVADFYVKELGLDGFGEHYPADLSGGMRQRVGLARALAIDPEVLLMDEPFSQLDSFTAARLRKDVLDIWAREHMTVIIVTHLIEEAIELADRILVMTARPGTVESIVENTVSRPRNDRMPEFWKIEDLLTEMVKF